MNFEFTIEEIILILLIIKNQLINADTMTLRDSYNSGKEDFNYFLVGVEFLSKLEPAFFLLQDDIITKCSDIISDNRDKEEAKANYTIINKLISFFNVISHKDDISTAMDIYHYQIKQSIIRNYKYKSYHQFVESISYDAYAYQKINDNDLDDIKRKDLFIISLNYLVKDFSYIFNNDNFPNICRIIDEYKKERKILDFNSIMYCKNTKKLIKRIL